MIPSFDDQVQWGLALPFFLAAALLQIALGPRLGLFGGHADIVLIVVTGWAMIRSAEEAMVAGPPAALIAGLLGAGPIGIPVLALMPPIGISLILRSGGAMPRLPSVCTVMAVTSVMAVMIDVTVQFLAGGRNFEFSGFVPVTLGGAALNVLLAALLYRLFCLGRKRKLVRRRRLSLS